MTKYNLRTIGLISDAIAMMSSNNLPATLTIGTFTVKGTGSLQNWAGSNGQFNHATITFKLCCETIHLQKMIEMGVKFNKQELKAKTGQYNVTCSLSTLKSLDKYCRWNHLDCVAINNFHSLLEAGWNTREKYISYSTDPSKEGQRIANFLKSIRKNASSKNKSEFLPIEKRAFEKINY